MICLLDIGRVNVIFSTMQGFLTKVLNVFLLFGYQIADKPLQCCVGGFYSQQLQGCQTSKTCDEICLTLTSIRAQVQCFLYWFFFTIYPEKSLNNMQWRILCHILRYLPVFWSADAVCYSINTYSTCRSCLSVELIDL